MRLRVDLPEEFIQEVKRRAERNGRTMKEEYVALLRVGLTIEKAQRGEGALNEAEV